MKILHRTYIPFLSDAANPQTTLCPLCSHLRSSLSHRLWSYKSISTVWDQTLSFIHGITSAHLPKDPLLLIFGYWNKQLFSGSPNITSFKHKSWILISLLVVRRTILKNWTLSIGPTISLIKRELPLLLYREKIGTDCTLPSSRASFYKTFEAFMFSTMPIKELDTFEESFSYRQGLQQLYSKNNTF